MAIHKTFTSLAFAFNATAELFEDNSNKVVRAVGIQFMSYVIPLSPVKSGRFRNNWFVSIDDPNLLTTIKTNMQGSESFRRTKEVTSSYNGGTLIFTNNLPYAQKLENGGSQQAPANFTAISAKNAIRSIRGAKILRR